ncbi:hypothetical protein DB30_05084 [Enhygromyxa salina]|uniref:Uncharacterized protein n=1 Tax=Enhygromyxa salina TaxID=215803 RepID=A0A0C2D2N4_9BACT|nr:hypothetical protein DB30_05084 [Enhygromyxa salina]
MRHTDRPSRSRTASPRRGRSPPRAEAAHRDPGSQRMVIVSRRARPACYPQTSA